MMPSVHRRLGAAAVLLSVAAAPVMALNQSTQQSQPRRWWKTGPIVNDLGLSAEQSARIDAIFERALPELRLEREELERLEAKLSRMIQDDRIDEATLARQIDRVETARASGNKTRSVMLMRMHRVLTADQRVRFEELSKKWPAGGRGSGPGSAPPAAPETRSPSGPEKPRF